MGRPKKRRLDNEMPSAIDAHGSAAEAKAVASAFSIDRPFFDFSGSFPSQNMFENIQTFGQAIPEPEIGKQAPSGMAWSSFSGPGFATAIFPSFSTEDGFSK